ncbi:RHTO0S11e04632g1_1 [Rhodotorula toruloides]|uniref:RHTO0S11e04632g1_1 n=2 Tax=Rhodotorula toruloides TaxID=5286 RepID=A0A061B788_RHOTO|nr:uncharacterized protein RHTO_01658 [Rhodotorula toruloides NP11]EMS21598.1 hypothetical protein RHTO_01658 [Rhodotorula toruloides NP11]CDR45772.1 RHTO0S11e04632g1_1 [Rhodotorula toruloides]
MASAPPVARVDFSSLPLWPSQTPLSPRPLTRSLENRCAACEFMAITSHESGEGVVEPAQGAVAREAFSTRPQIRTTRLASATASHDEDVEEQDISDSTSEDSSDMDQERPPHHHAWPAQLDHPLADVLIADGTDGVALGSPYLPYSPAEQVRRRMEARTREGADAGDGSEVEDESGEGEGEEGEGSSGGDDEGELENEDGEKEETEGEEAGGSSGNES